ncbi:hypothetical protein NEOKW01_0009 [Nematocida sp. AWRm80]|nr:hypothetical protein NEOKW01_0009 [Nematocida sp. AWRm80]
MKKELQQLKERIVPTRQLNLPNMLLRSLRQRIFQWYYRYTTEIGISTLDTWEACIVNSIFLLLLVSITKQVFKGSLFVLLYLYTVLGIKQQ